ncbi:MAG: tripartite tricarboxylate transporter substrate-binding protein [Candidatus Binatia bacterium]
MFSSRQITGKSMLFIFFVLQFFLVLPVAAAFSQAEPFYKGKQIRIVTGATAGGFYDRWARLLARAMPKYIPGQPDMIVQNMPGAGSLVALNYVYGVVKPDGLTAVMPNSNVYLEQLSGHKEVRFDLRKFPIIGSQEKNFMLLYMRADAPYKTIGDIIKAAEPPKCGSTGIGSAGYTFSTACWSWPWARRSIRSWVIREEMKSISQWKRARFNAGEIPSCRILGANRSILGIRRASTVI